MEVVVRRRKSSKKSPLKSKTIFGQEDSDHGTFSEEPQTMWLTETHEDRNMRLLDLFFFTDPDGKLWKAKKGYQTDGASIPPALWALIGSPFTGNYRRAAIVHDVACDDAGDDYEERLAADRMFYHACRAGGCSLVEAIILYIGVRIGWYLPDVEEWSAAQLKTIKPRLHLTEDEELVQRDFRRVAERVLSEGETDDPHVIEKRTERVLKRVLALRKGTVNR
jgi:hypothetical protein